MDKTARNRIRNFSRSRPLSLYDRAIITSR